MLSDHKLKLIDLLRQTPPTRGAHVELDSIAQLKEALGRPVRVGVARVDGIGDWVLTIPLIESLRASADVSSVTLFGPAGHRSLLEQHGVDFIGIDVWASHHTPWPHGGIGKLLAISALGQRRACREGRRMRGAVDLIVVPRWDTDRGQNMRFFAVGLGVPVAGHTPSEAGQASPKELSEARVLALRCDDARPYAHESDRVEALVRALNLRYSPAPLSARHFFSLPLANATPAAPVLVMHTGAHDRFRRWPEQNWRELLQLVLANSSASIILIGDKSDIELHERLEQEDQTRVTSLAGRSKLADLPQVIDDASAFIGGDSGPAHIAAAIGVPTFVLSCFPEGDDPSHPNSPDRFAARSDGGEIFRPGPQPQPFETMNEEERAQLLARVLPPTVWETLKRVVKSEVSE